MAASACPVDNPCHGRVDPKPLTGQGLVMVRPSLLVTEPELVRAG
jgi:hypothetical protein